jgi:hypothetical protein
MSPIENEKDLLVALQAEFGNRQFKFKKVLSIIHKYSDKFIHSTKIFAMLRKLIEDGKLNELEHMKYKLTPMEGGTTMKKRNLWKIDLPTVTTIRNKTANQITASVKSVLGAADVKKDKKKKKLGAPKKEIASLGKKIDKLGGNLSKIKSEMKDIDTKIKKLKKREAGVKLGKVPSKLNSLANKIQKILVSLEDTLEKA